MLLKHCPPPITGQLQLQKTAWPQLNSGQLKGVETVWYWKQAERDTQRQTDTERQVETDTHRETRRHTQRLIDRQRDRWRHTQRSTETQRKQIEGQTHTERQRHQCRNREEEEAGRPTRRYLP